MNLQHLDRVQTLIFILTLLLIAPTSFVWDGAASTPDHPTVTRAKARWTVLSYMNGDNNLETDMIGDLEEMERIAGIDGLDIIVQLDRHSGWDTTNGDWTDTRRFLVADHPSPGIGSTRLDISPLGELNMDDPAVLRDFLVFGLTSYPADHYMLIIEGHANGPAKGIFKDESSTLSSQGEMEVHDMGAVIREAVDATIGAPLDVISFDVCWMGMVETAYEVKDHASYMVGSFDEIPRAGWPYDICLPLIVNSSLPMRDRLSSVVDAYMDFYQAQGMDYPSLAAVDLSAFGQKFTPRFTALSEEMFYTSPDHGSDYYRIMKMVDTPKSKTNNANDRYLDLYQFLGKLVNDDSIPSPVRQYAHELEMTQGEVIVRSRGAANHPQASKLFGIYFPTLSEEAPYSRNVLSALTAWDEYIITYIRGLDLVASRVNWTSSPQSQVTFWLKSSTSSMISQVEVETAPLGGGAAKRTVLPKEGNVFSVRLDTSGTVGLSYRYIVRTIWGTDVKLPPVDPHIVYFKGESNPPMVLHIPPAVLDPSTAKGLLEFYVWDETGIEKSAPEKAPRLEYRQKGTEDWYSIFLRAGRYEPLRGRQLFSGFPSGMPPGERVEYHIFASDTLGNTARVPAEGEFESIMFKGERFVLDAARSDLSSYGQLISLFSSLGISIGVDPIGGLEGLDEAKGYVLLDPVSALDIATAKKVKDFHLGGGSVMLVMDPTDNGQVSKASVLLQELGILVAPEGSVSGYYPSNKGSELGSTLPPLYGTSVGSFEPVFSEVDGDVPVYYTTPPLASAMTGWNGKGRYLACISSLLSDSSMGKASNKRFAELGISYLARNIPPTISVKVTPGLLVSPGEKVSFDLSGSFDRDGTIVSYGMRVSDGTSKGGTSFLLEHIFQASGSYDVELYVEDGSGEVSREGMVIKVNRRPETDHGISPAPIYAGTKVLFDLKGKDPEGDEVFVLWDFGDGLRLSGSKVEHIYSMRGRYNYTLTVTDLNGLVSTAKGIITVLNSAPVAIIEREGITVNGGPGSFSGPSMITLFVSEGDLLRIPSTGSYDRDRYDVPSYRWEMGDGTVLDGKEATHRYFISGPKTVILNLTDPEGASSEAKLSVMVLNTLPSADLDAFVGKGRTVSFDASSTLDDPWDLANMTFRWDLGDGTKKATDSPFLEHRYRWGGTYKVRLTAVDPDGARSTVGMEVDVPGISLFQTVLLAAALLLVIITAVGVALLALDRRLAREGKGLSDLLGGNAPDRRGSPKLKGFSERVDHSHGPTMRMGPSDKPGHGPRRE